MQIEKEHGIAVAIVRPPGKRTTGTRHDTQDQTEQETQQPEARPAGFVLQADGQTYVPKLMSDNVVVPVLSAMA